MEVQVSKSNFKAQALEIMRGVEESGEEVVITSHGTPCLVVKKYKDRQLNPFDLLKDSVIEFHLPTEPVVDDDWELA